MTDPADEQDQHEQEAASGPPGASEDELDEIEEERTRRLAPENRPENTEVDNTGSNAPDLSRVDPEVDEDAAGQDDPGPGADGDDGAEPGGESGAEGDGVPGASEDELDEIEEERTRRLAPENRPENTEVDNTGSNAPDLSRVDPEVDEDA